MSVSAAYEIDMGDSLSVSKQRRVKATSLVSKSKREGRDTEKRYVLYLAPTDITRVERRCIHWQIGPYCCINRYHSNSHMWLRAFHKRCMDPEITVASLGH